MNFNISNKSIGVNQPCFIIAEISANHKQSYELAVKTLEAVKEAGADAVKFQTFTPDTITIDSDQEYFNINHGTIWDGKTMYELYKEAYMPWEWQPKLKSIAESLELICFSSPFDESSVDFLRNIDVPAFKIASPEITDIPLIEYTASVGKPIIISTGIATLNDLENALNACYKVGNKDVALLKCTSAYPTPLEEANLNLIEDLKNRFGVVVGLSDHTCGYIAPVVAVAKGASIIEKHFIIDKDIDSLDADFSLDKNEFSQMVKAIRNAEKTLGEIDYKLSSSAIKARLNCRSLFVVEDIKRGDTFSEKNIKSIRPGQGLKPQYVKLFHGKKAINDYKKGTPVSSNMLLPDDIDQKKLLD